MPDLSDQEFWHRFQFALTLIYRYLFPQLTMASPDWALFSKYGGNCHRSDAGFY